MPLSGPSLPTTALSDISLTNALAIGVGISIGDFHYVFKFHAYSVNKRLFLFLMTAKLAGASNN